MNDQNQSRLDEIKTSLSIADELQRDDCDWLIEQLTAANQALAESQQREAELKARLADMCLDAALAKSKEILESLKAPQQKEKQV